jgi:Protein of unknown function (DUF3102)
VTAANHTLPQIAKAIKALEKKTIANVVEIGRLLHEAKEQCEFGEYMKWLESEFGWSHDTALNYRNVYDLKIRTRSDFADWDITLSALYLVARLLKDDEPDHRGVGEAILAAAQRGRVSHSIAKEISGKYLNDHPDVESEADDDQDDVADDDDDAEPEAEPAAVHTGSRSAGPVSADDEPDDGADDDQDEGAGDDDIEVRQCLRQLHEYISDPSLNLTTIVRGVGLKKIRDIIQNLEAALFCAEHPEEETEADRAETTQH